MDFHLSEEQQLLGKFVRQLMLAEVAPRSAEIDEKGEFPWDVFELCKRHELFALVVPTEYGGTGASILTQNLVNEEMHRVDASAGRVWNVQAVGSTVLFHFGSEEQKRRFGPAIARGDLYCAYSLSEPDAGSDVAAMSTRARPDGDDFLLSGTKQWTSHGNVADLITLFAKAPTPGGEEKITAFLVERPAPGLEIGHIDHKLGIRGSPTCQLILDNVRVPRANVIGQVGQGMRIALSAMNETRIGAASAAVGIAQGALDFALQYSKERVTFGAPIAKHQAIQFMLADMETAIQAARLLYYQAAEKYDENAPDLIRWASMCKLFATDMVGRVTRDAVQILGGYGFVKDFPVERMLRDAVIYPIFDGSNQIQRIVIARELTGLR